MGPGSAALHIAKEIDVTPANQSQVGGDHYRKHDASFQHWDMVHHFNLDYFQGQITRYLFRWRDKGGLQDLRKSKHMLEKYIELMEQEQKALSEKMSCEPSPRYVGQ